LRLRAARKTGSAKPNEKRKEIKSAPLGGKVASGGRANRMGWHW